LKEVTKMERWPESVMMHLVEETYKLFQEELMGDQPKLALEHLEWKVEGLPKDQRNWFLLLFYKRKLEDERIYLDIYDKWLADPAERERMKHRREDLRQEDIEDCRLDVVREIFRLEKQILDCEEALAEEGGPDA
jgi:hypothetical protein